MSSLKTPHEGHPTCNCRAGADDDALGICNCNERAVATVLVHDFVYDPIIPVTWRCYLQAFVCSIEVISV